jgi:hypothetical protein
MKVCKNGREPQRTKVHAIKLNFPSTKERENRGVMYPTDGLVHWFKYMYCYRSSERSLAWNFREKICYLGLYCKLYEKQLG